MHNLKAWIWYAMNSSPNYKKEKYLKEDGAHIDKEQQEIPKPLPSDHPLSKSLSISKILHSIQLDVDKLLDDEYESAKITVENPKPLYGTVEKKHNSPSPKHDNKLSSITSDFFAPSIQASRTLNPVKVPFKQLLKKDLKEINKQDISPLRSRHELSPHKHGGKAIGLLGTYIKSPTDGIEVTNNSPRQKYKSNKDVSGVAPTMKTKEHLSTINQNKQLFKDIFVKPSEAKIEQLQKRESMFQTTEPEEDKPEPTKPRRKHPQQNDNIITKDLTGEFKDLFNDDNDDNIETPQEPRNDSHNEIIKIVMQIFSANKAQKGETFFNQQIQVQPPEGLNATVAAPLTPGGGWAPSIPNVSNLSGNTSLKVNYQHRT